MDDDVLNLKILFALPVNWYFCAFRIQDTDASIVTSFLSSGSNNAREKEVQKSLTDITEIYLCSRQRPHQTESAFKFVLKNPY